MKKVCIDVIFTIFVLAVFVLNNADREDFSVENYRAMQEVIMKIFEKSKLKFTGGLYSVESTTANSSSSEYRQFVQIV